MAFARFFAVFFVLLAAEARAQDFHSIRYSTREGLPSNFVFGAAQDLFGQIWFGTVDGLSRFDGKNFENFSRADGLADMNVLRVFCDRSNALWFSSYNGRLSGCRNGQFLSAENDAFLKSLDNRKTIVRVSERGAGGLAVQAIGAVFLQKKDGSGWAVFDQNKLGEPVSMTYALGGSDFLLLKKRLARVFENDETQTVLPLPTLGGPGHLFTTERPEGGFLGIDSAGAIFKVTEKLALENAGHLADFGTNPAEIKRLVATKGSFWLFLKTGGAVQVLENGERRQLLDGVSVNDVLEDREQNFWFSTQDGVYFFPSYFSKTRLFTKKNGLASDRITRLEFDASGQLWVGHDGSKMTLMTDGKIIRTVAIKSEPSQLIQRLLPFGPNMIVGLNERGIFEIGPENAPVRALPRMEKGQKVPFATLSLITGPDGLLTATFVNRVVSFDPKTGAFSREIYADSAGSRIFRHFWDARGRLLLSKTTGVSVVETDGRERRLDTGRFPILAEQMIALQDIEGGAAMLLGPRGFGLLLVRGDTIAARLTKKDGLPSDDCQKIYVDRGEIWIKCRTGVAEIGIDATGKMFVKRAFDQSNAIPLGSVGDMALNEKTIYLGTESGLLAIDRTTKPTASFLPDVHITSVSTRSERVFDWAKPLAVRERDLPLRVVFQHFSYPLDPEIEYEYRLGEDQNWTPTAARSLEFGDLASGNHCLQIRARRSGAAIGPTELLFFEVKTPFWREAWFWFSLGALAVIGAISWFSRREIRIAQARRRALEQEIAVNRLENQALQSSMHPHFMFNALNSIQHFLNDSDRLQANRYLAKFAKLMRMNLLAGTQGYLSLEEEVERLQHYLALEALRLEGIFEHRIEIGPELSTSDTFLPAMIVQPYLENALWHGLAPAGKGGFLAVSFLKNDARTLEIRIEDNGVGIEKSRKIKKPDGHRSQALEIIRKWVELLSRQFALDCRVSEAPFQPENSERPGHAVSIFLPLVGREELEKL